MTNRTADQIRLFFALAAMMGGVVVMSVAPMLLAAL